MFLLCHNLKMQKDSELLARTRLKNLRKSHQLTQVEVALKGNFKLDSNYRYYENKFSSDFLPSRMEWQITKAFLGHGTPPIEKHEILSLFHVEEIVATLCPEKFNGKSLQQESPQSGILNCGVESTSDSVGVNSLFNKAFPALTQTETKLLIEEGQVMKGLGVRYGQIVPMEDEAMAPELPYGMRVLYDPVADLEDGCYVFVHMNKMPRLVCRQYSITHQDGRNKVIRLTPLNSAFDSYSIDENMQGRIVGRVVFAFRSF